LVTNSIDDPQGESLWNVLAGVRVLEVAGMVAGPYAATVLSYFGADVTKLEPLTGDGFRKIKPDLDDDLTAMFAAVNTDKKYVAIDLKDPRSKPIVCKLIAQSDVFIENLRPGSLQALGLGPQEVHAINPKVIYCSITAFYPDEGTRPGVDVLVQAESGIMSMTGEADRAPSRVPIPAIDISTALWAAIAIMNALRCNRERIVMNISLQDVAINLLNGSVAPYLAAGTVPRRLGSRTEPTTPHGAYFTSDSSIVIAAGTDEFFGRLADIVGPPVKGDSRFVTTVGRLAHRDELDEKLAQLLKRRPSQDWYERLSAAGIPVAVIRDLDDAVDNHIARSPTGVRPLGDTSVLAPPIHAINDRWELRTTPGRIGRDTGEVLQRLGIGSSEVESLQNAGVIV